MYIFVHPPCFAGTLRAGVFSNPSPRSCDACQGVEIPEQKLPGANKKHELCLPQTIRALVRRIRTDLWAAGVAATALAGSSGAHPAAPNSVLRQAVVPQPSVAPGQHTCPPVDHTTIPIHHINHLITIRSCEQTIFAQSSQASVQLCPTPAPIPACR